MVTGVTWNHNSQGSEKAARMTRSEILSGATNPLSTKGYLLSDDLQCVLSSQKLTHTRTTTATRGTNHWEQKEWW